MPKADIRVVMDIVKNLEERITNLELANTQKPEAVDDEGTITMCDGRKIKGGKK